MEENELKFDADFAKREIEEVCFPKLKPDIITDSFREVSSCVAVYDSAHIGAVGILNFFNPKLCADIITEITELEAKGSFAKSQDTYGSHNVAQQFFRKYFDETELDKLPKYIAQGLAIYQDFYTQVSKFAHFTPRINSVGIHKYPPASVGLGMHLDHSCCQNAVSIVTLSGKATFVANSTRSLDDALRIPLREGTLCYMRAPRNESVSEKKLRPFHSVVDVTQERYALLFRYNFNNTDLGDF
jgi:hypothetical protein